MDSVRPSSAPARSKLAKTFRRVIHLKTSSKSISNNGFCFTMPHEKLKCCDSKSERHEFEKEDGDCGGDDEVKQSKKNRASMEAFVAKLFATVSAVKAAYAELQMAQLQYSVDAVQTADQAVVDELKVLSELKQSFLKKRIDPSPPHVTLLLAEIQEQQSLMKTYEITMKKLQAEIDSRDSRIDSLRRELGEINLGNKSLEKKLNESGSFSILDGVNPASSNPKDFVVVLHYALRSVRNFVKQVVREMESAKWDIEAATNAMEPEIAFRKPNHRCFVFESFVCREIFDGFNLPDFSLPNEALPEDGFRRRLHFSEAFKRLKSVGSVHFLRRNQNSAFGKFLKTKYLRLVHPKMETSFSGNLNQRKMISSGEWPETAFFAAFAEMARRVWLLHCLAFSFDREVGIFQVGKNCRFSEVYMESLNDEVFSAGDGDFRVAFTVVPGFKIGDTVVQSQVYLSPVRS